jgi:hypothetical protein
MCSISYPFNNKLSLQQLVIEAPWPAVAGLKRDSPPSADSKCKEVIPFYCSSLANPVRLRRTTGTALAVAFSLALLIVDVSDNVT